MSKPFVSRPNMYGQVMYRDRVYDLHDYKRRAGEEHAKYHTLGWCTEPQPMREVYTVGKYPSLVRDNKPWSLECVKWIERRAMQLIEEDYDSIRAILG